MVKSEFNLIASSLNKFGVDASTRRREAKETIMRKQLLKGLAMLMAVMAMALVTAVATANAQSQNTKANVPFEFTVGDKSLPAGAYAISAVTSSGDTLRIRSVTGSYSTVQVTMTASGKSDHAKLVFHRYGERYFLAEIWSGEGGRALAPSREERAIKKELSRIAANQSGQRTYEKVEIALAVH